MKTNKFRVSRSRLLSAIWMILGCLTLSVSAQLPNSFVVTVDKGGGEMVELNLSKHTIRSANCRIVSWDSTNGYVEEHTQANPAMPARTYRGYVTENPNELVLAVVHSNNTLQAEAHDGSGRLWTISGVDVTTELGNGTATLPTPAPLAAGSGTTVASGLPGQYLPAIGLYRAHGVEDVPSQFYDSNGQSLEQTLVWLEHQWNVFDFFNARDTKLSMELTEVIIRKEQFYFPTAGNAGQFNSMLKTEWTAQGQNARGFIHSWFPYNFTYAGGYASGNEFYGANHAVSVNALYHEVGHNWRAQHYFYGRETMTGSHPSHGEMNTQRVLYTRQIQIDQDDGIEALTSYSTNLHPRAYQDVASTLVDTATNISPMENDHDANGDTLSIKSFTSPTAQGGTVTEAGGVLTYTPAAGYVGKDIVVYEVQDTAGLYTKGAIHIEVINQGLAAHWAMEDSAGTSATDGSGNGHAGALVNADFSTASVPGPVGNALSLGSSAYVIGDDSNLITHPDTAYPLDSAASNFFDPMDQDFTVSTWFQLQDGASSATVFSKINNANLGYKLVANAGSGFTATVRVWDGLQGSFSVSSGSPVIAGAWYHVAMVINRGDDTLRLYVNGAEVGTPSSLPTGFFVFNGREDFKIGGSGAMAVDETQIQTKALSLAEIQVQHNAGEVPAAPMSPANNSLGQALDANLEWLAGNASYQHDVYFGTDAAAVAAATTASPEYKGRQSGTTFDPGALSTSTTYFWRIDEVDGGTIIPSGVWQFSTAANALVNGLVLHLTMDDADVQTADGVTHTYDDIALPSNDFFADAATPGATGVIGQAVDLTGTADSLRSYTTNAVVSPATGGLTVSFWINTTSVQNGGEKVFDMGGGVFVRYYNGDLQPVFDGSSGGAITMDANVNDGQWHHVVAQNDGAGTTTIYVDGSVIGTQSEGLQDLASLGREMSIGATYNSTGENLTASYDDFAVWQRTLSPAEVAVIHSEGLAGRSFNAEPVLIDTSFEVADGFTGFTVGSASALGTVVDNGGVTWTEVADADIWNRTDIPPAGVQALTLGLSSSLSQCDIAIPGTTHGVGTVSFDYASFSGSTNVAFKLLYNTGSGWVEAWSTQMVGMSPSFSTKPWGTAEVALNIPGDVDLRFEMSGNNGGMIDNLRVTGMPVNTAPSFVSDPFSAANALENNSYNGTISGSATDADTADVLTYSKVSGPAWLSVASDGTLSGTPTTGDLGLNAFNVEVSDGNGGTATATLNVTVDTASVAFTDDFERSAGTTIGGGWVEQTNDSRIFNTGNGATQMVISVSAGVPFAIVNQLADTYVVGESYELGWNAARATSANGTLNYDVSIGTWDGSTFTPLASQNGSISNLNLFGKTAGPAVSYTATAVDAGQSIAVRFEVLSGSSDWAGFDDVQLTVIGGNNAPAFTADPINKANATEDSAYAGTISGDAADPDTGDTLSFSKIGGPAWLSVASDGSLSGTPTNGDVGNNAFTVRVTDLGGLSDDATLNINVINSNDPPVASDNSASIAENVANGTAVVTVAASDPDVGDSLSYAITAGNTGGAFAIDSNGNITTAAAIDYETVNSYSLTVTVTDTSSATDTATVTVTITNENEAPTAVDNSASVQDDLTVGAAVVTVAATDPDAGDSLSYAITAGNTGGAFAIDNNGNITTATALDAATTSSYTLTVTVTDSGSLTDTATVSITVTAANSAPVFASDPITGDGGMLFVAYTGTLAGSATDVDAGDTLTYSKTSGPSWLSVATDGELTGTPTATDGGLNAFTVEVSDGNGGTDSATLNITVAETGVVYLEDFQGYDVENPSDFSVGGTPTGNWTASNTASNATRIFDTSNYGGTRLWISNVDGTSITSSGIEVGADTHYTMSVAMVTETSVGGRTLNASYDILVGQDAATATSIIGGAQAVVTDGDDWQTPDSKTDHTFTHSFQTGTLNPGDKVFLRYERVSTLVTGGWLGVDDVQLTLDGLNVAPVADDDTLAVAENAGAGAAVGTVSASDANTNDTLTYAITAGNGGGEFAIDANNGAITATASLNYEVTNSYAFTVTVTDGGGLTDTAAITVNVSDVNEAPSLANSNGSNGQENVAYSGSIAGTATDPDAGETFSYSKVSGPAWLSVATDGSLSGTPTVGDAGTNVWTVRVTDGGGLTADATLTIEVDAATPPADPASNPSIVNGATGVDLNPTLGWDAATGADSYDIYFGTTAPGTFQGNQATTSFDPGTLLANTTYFWRVDTVNGSGTTTGTVWSFTTGTGGPVTLFTDDFEDGNLTGWTTTGNATAQTSAANTGVYGARLRATASMTISIDTSAVASVTLEYDRRTRNYDSGELLTVEWSTDGSSWNTVETTNSTSWSTTNVVLPAGAAGQAALQVRFSTNANRNNEHGRIDNVTVTGN